MTATELFINKAYTSVASGHTNVAQGTVETWVVNSSALFVDYTGATAVTGVTQFRVVDPADAQLPPEVILVTNVSGTSWTVTRGADNTTPTVHSAGFTVEFVATSQSLTSLLATAMAAITAETTRAEAAEAALQPLLTLLPTSVWATGTIFSPIQGVTAAGLVWLCLATHTSGTFSTDVADGLWMYTGPDPSVIVAFPGPTAVKTANYTASVADLVRCDSSSAGFTVTMPTTPPNGSLVDVAIINGTNMVTIAAGGADAFNRVGGPTTESLKSANQKMRFVYYATDAVWIAFDAPSPDGLAALTETLTNKRITKRVLALSANSATPTINTDNCDVVEITGQSAAITSFTTNLTGTPTADQPLLIAITGTGSIGLTWGSEFESSTITLPSATVGTAKLMVGLMWNTVTSKWRCVGVA